jgi:hypothetical protein
MLRCGLALHGFGDPAAAAAVAKLKLLLLLLLLKVFGVATAAGRTGGS